MTTMPRTFASFNAAVAVTLAKEIAGETFLAAHAESDRRRAAQQARLALIEVRTGTPAAPHDAYLAQVAGWTAGGARVP
jgi:hypothetical protein